MMDAYSNPGRYARPPLEPTRGVLLNVWHALWPPALYMAMQIVVSLAAGVVLNARLMLSGELAGLDLDQLQAVSADTIYAWTMPIMAISMALSLAVLIPLYLRARRGRETPTRLSELGPGNILLILGLTLASYFAIILAVSLLPQNFGDYAEHMETLTSGSAALQLLVVGLGAPIVEELCMRGMCEERLLRILPPAWAILIQAAIFGIIHWNIVQSSYAFLMGVLMGWLYYRSRSLWAPFFCHFFMNAGNVLITQFLNGDQELPSEPAPGVADALPTLLPALAFALALTAVLVFALNKTLPGRRAPAPSAPLSPPGETL